MSRTIIITVINLFLAGSLIKLTLENTFARSFKVEAFEQKLDTTLNKTTLSPFLNLHELYLISVYLQPREILRQSTIYAVKPSESILTF